MRSLRESESMRRCIIALLPVLLTFARFWNGFVFDDVFVIETGTFIHDPRNLAATFRSHAMVASTLDSAVGSVPLDTYRPLTIASFFWDSALSGTSPWAYHLTNLLLHAVNSVLVLELLRRIVPDAPANLRLVMAAWFSASVWLCETHVFINGRSDLFLTLFVLLAVLAQRTALERGARASMLGAAACMFAAMLAKETAVVALPFVLLVPTATAVSSRRRSLYALPSLALLGVYLVARTFALSGLRVHAGPTKLWMALSNLPLLWRDTLIHTWLPTPYTLRNLRDEYEATSALLYTLACLLLLGSGAALLVLLRKRQHVGAWGLALAFVTASPAVMISTELWPGFGRYLYLPAVGIFCMLTLASIQLTRVAGRLRRIVELTPVLLCLLSAGLLVDATLGFRDDLTLYRRALAKTPEFAWTHGSLGLTYKREGQCRRAVPLLARADGMTKPSEEPRYATALARCLVTLGAFRQAADVARSGRARFRGLRPEAGFIIAEFLTLPRGHPSAGPLMQRCLRLWPGRRECIEGLDLVLSERKSATAFY